MHSLTRSIAPLAALATLAACGGEADDTPALGPGPAEIAERQDNFEGLGDSFKAIRTQLETGSPDFAVIEDAALDMSQRARNIERHFPAGSGRDDGYDTEALATIWERPEDFAAAQESLIEESDAMVEAAQSGEAAVIGAQVKDLGGSCKNCHDDFRLDTD